MTFLPITPIYLSECVITSIGISEPVPEKLKLLHNIFLRCFTYHIEMGRTKLFILSDPDKSAVLPLIEKITFISK